jgi:hypothetical protein
MITHGWGTAVVYNLENAAIGNLGFKPRHTKEKTVAGDFNAFVF